MRGCHPTDLRVTPQPPQATAVPANAVCPMSHRSVGFRRPAPARLRWRGMRVLLPPTPGSWATTTRRQRACRGTAHDGRDASLSSAASSHGCAIDRALSRRCYPSTGSRGGPTESGVAPGAQVASLLVVSGSWPGGISGAAPLAADESDAPRSTTGDAASAGASWSGMRYRMQRVTAAASRVSCVASHRGRNRSGPVASLGRCSSVDRAPHRSAEVASLTLANATTRVHLDPRPLQQPGSGGAPCAVWYSSVFC